jgi:hypothetical protein
MRLLRLELGPGQYHLAVAGGTDPIQQSFVIFRRIYGSATNNDTSPIYLPEE